MATAVEAQLGTAAAVQPAPRHQVVAFLVMVAVLGIASAPAAATARSVSGEAQLTPAQAPTAKPAVTNTTHGTSADLLPFSGVDLAFAVLVAGGLVLLGAALRRLSAGQSQN